MSQPLDVSVVISVYNEASHVGEAVASLLSQDGISFEIIVVDDGSTDASAAVVEHCAGRDPRVRLLRQRNTGLTHALIRACLEARGRFIARHDASDISVAGRLAAQHRALAARADLSFVACWTEFCGPNLEPLYVATGTGQAAQPAYIVDLNREYAVSDGPTHHGSVMMRKDAYMTVGGYRAEFHQAQDWDLWYRLAQVGLFQVLPQVFYRARMTPEGLTFAQGAVRREFSRLPSRALRCRAAGVSEEPVLAEARRLSALPKTTPGGHTHARGHYFIGECLRRRKDRRAAAYLARAVEADPWFVKARLRLWQARLACALGARS